MQGVIDPADPDWSRGGGGREGSELQKVAFGSIFGTFESDFAQKKYKAAVERRGSLIQLI